MTILARSVDVWWVECDVCDTPLLEPDGNEFRVDIEVDVALDVEGWLTVDRPDELASHFCVDCRRYVCRECGRRMRDRSTGVNGWVCGGCAAVLRRKLPPRARWPRPTPTPEPAPAPEPGPAPVPEPAPEPEPERRGWRLLSGRDIALACLGSGVLSALVLTAHYYPPTFL